MLRNINLTAVNRFTVKHWINNSSQICITLRNKSKVQLIMNLKL